MCNYINHFFFLSAQAIIWSVWANSFPPFVLHCCGMGIYTSIVTSYTTLGFFCYLLTIHFCNIFTLVVAYYYEL